MITFASWIGLILVILICVGVYYIKAYNPHQSMLVNLTKDEIKKIVFWLKFTEDKDLGEKLEPLIEVCTCKEPEGLEGDPEGHHPEGGKHQMALWSNTNNIIEPKPKKTRQGEGKHSKYAASSRNAKRKRYKGQGK